jgi:nitroreductase
MRTSTDRRTGRGARLGSDMRECLLAATAAPSVHNTQPWRFRPHVDGVDVFADPVRRLEVIDPSGREALISVGAAVFNLRVAILAHGRLPITRTFPFGDRSALVARVTFGPPVPATGTVRMLAEAIPRRHTNRRPFADTSLPRDVLAELAGAAAAEGGRLLVTDAGERDSVLSLVRLADGHESRDPRYRNELSAWTSSEPGRDDGIPLRAFGPASATHDVPLRDFGIVEPVRGRRAESFEPDPTIAILFSGTDTPQAWVQAGQALERVLLTATVRGVATTLMTQPLEIPQLRALLVRSAAGLLPQAIIRFGYGQPSPSSPRRPLSDVIDGAAPPRAGGPMHRVSPRRES